MMIVSAGPTLSPAIGKPSFCAALMVRLIWASVQITRLVMLTTSYLDTLVMPGLQGFLALSRGLLTLEFGELLHSLAP